MVLGIEDRRDRARYDCKHFGNGLDRMDKLLSAEYGFQDDAIVTFLLPSGDRKSVV